MYLLTKRGDLINMDKVNEIRIGEVNSHNTWPVVADFGDHTRSYSLAFLPSKIEAQAMVETIARNIATGDKGQVLDLAVIEEDVTR